jgi:hypothetical protein
VSSEVYLTVLTRGLTHVVTTTELKSVYLCIRQVRNLAMERFFFLLEHLDIHSWIMSSEVHLTNLSHVVTTTESKSVSLGVGSKPAHNIFTVYYGTELQ